MEEEIVTQNREKVGEKKGGREIDNIKPCDIYLKLI